MSEFKKNLKKEFTAKQLSDKQLERLLHAQTVKKSNKWIYSVIAVAACFVLIMLNTFTFSLPSKITSEIAYNHNKNMPSEVMTNDYSKINNVLTKLDFEVRDSPKLADYTLVGARYCSIQGKIAAQIQLENSKGKRFTLYQYEIDSDFDQTELSLETKGVKVTLWSEGNLHFGLAGDE